MLSAFAEVDDLRARGVNIPVEAAAVARAQAALDDVSAEIRAVAGKTWDGEDTPDIVFTVCCSAARRAYENPSNLRSQSIDGYADTRDGTVIGGVELTDDEKHKVQQAAGGTSPGIWTLGTTRGELETAWPFDPWESPVLLPTSDGDPIAWLDPSELPPT